MTEFRIKIELGEDWTRNPKSRWRADVKCNICHNTVYLPRDYLDWYDTDIEYVDGSLEHLMDHLKTFLERPLCKKCEEKVKKYGNNQQ